MALSPDRVHLSRDDDDDDVSTRYSPPERQTGGSREPGGERSVRLGAAINIKDIRNMQIRSFSTDYYYIIIMDLITGTTPKVHASHPAERRLLFRSWEISVYRMDRRHLHNLSIVLLLWLGINWMERICSESSNIRDVVGHLHDDGSAGWITKQPLARDIYINWVSMFL